MIRGFIAQAQKPGNLEKFIYKPADKKNVPPHLKNQNTGKLSLFDKQIGQEYLKYEE